jgi:hypothetical protein
MIGLQYGRPGIWTWFPESGTHVSVLRITEVGSEVQPSYLSLGAEQYSRDMKPSISVWCRHLQYTEVYFDVSIFLHCLDFNPLKTEHRLLCLKGKCVPRCKHF